MKMLMCGVTLSLATMAMSATAQQTLIVDGKEYEISVLMGDCQKITNDPAAQVACFSDISRLMAEQSAAPKEAILPVPEALQAFKNKAQYLDNDTGLSISGTDCTIQIVYFANYFHISRRNISTVDVISAQFDVSRLSHDQTSEVRGAQAPLVKGVMKAGASAVTHGGFALESSQHDFSPRSPGAALDSYAYDVIGQLPEQVGDAFEFVLVHPQRSSESAQVWGAFDDLVKACG